MSSRTIAARHRAAAPKTAPLAVIAKSVGNNAGTMGRQAAVIAAASGLVLTSGVAANAAESSVARESSAASTLEVQSVAQASISAGSSVAIKFERPAVKTVAAPVVEEAPVEVQEAEAPAAEAAAPAAKLSVTTQAAAAPATKVASGKGAAIAAAAYAQLGVAQDCTALASNSLAAVGINFHGWPADYLSLGRTVSAAEAQPGDLIYYQNGGMGMAHIAVYVGNGMAVHGGWNGGTTALYSANVGSGPVFIRVGG
ncbi:NlpC/P60 family protein [Arthrobacter cupressi]|uniref:NlpC/P60 family protein n=1 Tax=Arthrobacter cupressi TaxID=1045773 RepID=A0A1G8HZ70_9MICC|nr:NlpC/P60 family protein [Arthrobacter cupressi]NYD78852.1 cell wall-associated NlpC family hydrolase [Arthrobacter cupressi]SDI11976.1 NlpC/P60 family protein [Arthrobacter cupressi]